MMILVGNCCRGRRDAFAALYEQADGCRGASPFSINLQGQRKGEE